MIHTLKIRNFLSFKEEVAFTFEATSDKHLEKIHVVEVAPGVKLSKLAIVLGANASGKSNLVKAFEFLHDFWHKVPDNKDTGTDIIPFLLDTHSKNRPSEFELVFYLGHHKHVYTLEITDKHIISEKLQYYPGTQPAVIFERSLNQNVSQVRFGPKIAVHSHEQKEIEIKCLLNMSVFAAYNMVNVRIEELENVVSWMKHNYLDPLLPDIVQLENFTNNLLIKQTDIKEYILKFLSHADFNITGIKTSYQEKTIPEDYIKMVADSVGTSEEKERIKRDKTLKIPETYFTHKVSGGDKNSFSFYELPQWMQSNGTLRTMGIAGVINVVVNRNAFLAIDEIENSLHPKILEFILETFLKQSNRSQLLMTTHYDSLIEADDLLRNDSFWFTNKTNDGSTEIYSLSDFKGIKRISSLHKAYKYGKFGAIPEINYF